ncbi:unnamed protein product [Peronospora destructor]|uniref:Cation/H+ exchanger domain-containing protein n=1 Tax=Peronospora destructor TaxID=86335 RepID=A0AAV0TJK7_9STRA|nr:unnamed protein product [Peronospora destructor]
MKPRHLSLLVAALTAGAIIAVNATAATSLLASKRFLEEEKKDNDELVPFYSWDNVPETLSYLLAFVLVLLGAHPLGLFFPKYFGLPLITGYMVAGILSGPFLSNLLSVEAVTMFRPYVNAFALSFISLQAGQEIYLPELRPQLKSIAALLLTYYCTAMVIGTTIFMLAANAFFYADLATSCQVGIALMFASISVLVSPSTVMALKIEIDSVGPFTHLALGTCMMAEFVVLVSFSVSRVIASIYCAKLDVSAASITFTMGVVLTNVVLGVYLGLVTFLIFQIPSGVPDEISKLPAHHGASHVKKIECTDGKLEMSDLEQALKSHDRADLPHTTYVEEVESNMRVNKHGWTEGKALLLKGFIWLLMGYVFYLFTNTLSDITTAHFGLIWQVKFEALLVLMVASCTAGHFSAIRPQMHVILDTVAPYIFLPFFVMTGASLQLDKVLSVVPIMSLYLAVRYGSIFIAVYGGGRFLLKLPPQHYKNLWLTMAPQAGVSLGLAAEIIGPVLCSVGLRGAGEGMLDRQAAAAAASDDTQSQQGKEIVKPDAEGRKRDTYRRSLSSHNSAQRGLYSTRSGKDPRPLLPLRRVQSAVVIGDDEVAFEIALELSLHGARVNVPLLDEARADKWRRMNETILKRTANDELISFQNSMQDRQSETPVDSAMQKADVLIFTGVPERTLQQAKVIQTMLGKNTRGPRLIAVVDDCAAGARLRELGVLTVQPSIALGNIVTRLALLDAPLAAILSKELSSMSAFSIAAYFRGDTDELRESIPSLSELRLPLRRLALDRSVVNHHSVDYDRLAKALAAENLPMPPPPSRVSMFGTSAVRHDPFAKRSKNLGAQEHYVVEDDDFDGSNNCSIFEKQFLVPSPNSSAGGGDRMRSSRLSRRRSRLESSSSSLGGGAGFVTLHRDKSTGL